MSQPAQPAEGVRPRPPVKPEVLAPAGGWECARAAVENGADAIYFGVGRFNARVRADNFTEADLPGLMAFLHRRGVRGYATFNTLIFGNELEEAVTVLRSLITAGVDAAIVQDVGICRLIRRISPDFPIHASTQMTVTSAAGVDFARTLGASLVVLARECSIPEIEKIQDELSRTGAAVPLEVFVHGALCVAYSGQCLTSESLGGRSANRGECAQACRMPYQLVSDGQTVPLGDRRYLLSPQDLAGVEAIADLMCAGVCSLKIEGRLKSPEYVANITRVYRETVDRVWSALAGGTTPEAAAEAARAARKEFDYGMQMSFSRGLYTGWMHGINNRELVHANFGTKRGVYLGEVRRVAPPGVWLKLEADAKPGDGIVFDAGNHEVREEGGRIHGIEKKGAETFLRFGREDVDWKRVRPGNKIWKTSDPELERRVRQTYAGDAPKFRRPLHLELHGHVGAPLTVIARDDDGHCVRAASEAALEPAHAQPLTDETLRQQLGRLGGTAFTLGTLVSRLEGAVMLPVSELNRLRRRLVEDLDALRAAPKRWTLNPQRPGLLEISAEPSPTPPPPADAFELIPVVRDLAQLDAVLAENVRDIYAEFENPKHYRDAMARVRTLRSAAVAPDLWVAPPRIFKAGEDWILKQVLSAEADGYLVRAHEHLRAFAGKRVRGDFPLNVANPLTAEYFVRQHKLERLTASYDLNIRQLEALLRGAPPSWFEVTLHQHMPMFHMEHCVFCAFLSQGKDYRDCGRPCEKHAVALRDRVGIDHAVRADAGCRNTVFNGRAQTGAEFAQFLLDLGVRHFRIEFLNETPEEISRTLDRYRRLLRGELSGTALWRELKLHNQLGVTRGTLG